ncbi:hypothetical protein H0H92_009398 [Tricholoma furcatifolium]|nr:hypothetical protein H0H92_009398 [Tricholoma furcatifolium]
MLSLPVEIWLHVATFLPSSSIDELLGLNRLFFDLAMDARYGDIQFDKVTSKALKTLSQLRSYPTIARRVRNLTVFFDEVVRARENSPTPRSYSPTAPLQKLKSSLLHLNFRPSKSIKGPPTSFREFLEELMALFPTMINITFFHVYACQNLYKDYDLPKFFSAAWSGFGRSIRTLLLGGNLESFKVMLGTQPTLPALRDLRLEFTDILHTLILRAAFNRSFAEDSSGLTEVLYQVSPTLKDLSLRLAPTGSRLLNPDSDLILSRWFSATVISNERFSTGLRSIDIYAPATDAGLDSLIICIGRSAATLERLNVRDRFLFAPEITRILSAFHSQPNLTFLRLNVRELPVELLDLLAKTFPNLKTLELRAADGHPTPVRLDGLTS